MTIGATAVMVAAGIVAGGLAIAGIAGAVATSIAAEATAEAQVEAARLNKEATIAAAKEARRGMETQAKEQAKADMYQADKDFDTEMAYLKQEKEMAAAENDMDSWYREQTAFIDNFDTIYIEERSWGEDYPEPSYDYGNGGGEGEWV